MYLFLNQKTAQETEIIKLNTDKLQNRCFFKYHFRNKQIILYNCPNEFLKYFGQVPRIQKRVFRLSGVPICYISSLIRVLSKVLSPPTLMCMWCALEILSI